MARNRSKLPGFGQNQKRNFDSQRIRSVVVDLDDTLVASSVAGKRGLRLACRTMGVDPELFSQVSDRWWRWFRRGVCTLEECHLGQWIDCGLSEDLAREAHYLYFSASCLVRPRPGSVRLLRQLRRAGLRIAVLTNGSSVFQRAKIRRARLNDLVDHVAIDAEIGVSKPDPRAFQAVVEALGGELVTTVMIGDNFELDIVGALHAGFASAFWLIEDGPAPIVVDPRIQPIRHIDEALSLLVHQNRPP